MFERSLSDASTALQRVCDRSRAHNQATAALYLAIGELFRLRLREDGDRANWVIDTEEAVAVEVAATMRIGQGLALQYLRTARTMHERLPQLAAVFAAGDIDFGLFDALASRTVLITDPEVLDTVDTELAVKVPRWPSLSRGQICGRADRIVARHDRDAVRRRQRSLADRRIEIWNSGDGLSEIRAFVRNVDGHALDERLGALAATVCHADGRTTTQRRADALEAVLAGADRMACGCGNPDCPAGDKPPASSVVIHVIAEQSALDGADAAAAVLGVDELVPAEMLRELARTAKLVEVIHPADMPAEAGYVPSRALGDFVRCRDLTCRFPGCEKPARDADIDHTIPFGDGGRTHASNLKCLCRLHHLMKTFGDWRDRQLRDGTIAWTSPTGDTFVTTPGSALLFPGLMKPTAALPETPPATERCGNRTAMMPERRTTRAQNRQRRVADERRLNRQDREADDQIRRFEQGIRIAVDRSPPPF